MKLAKQIILVYKLLFWMFIPFVIGLLPVIPAILFNEYYSLLFIITFPLCIVFFGIATNKISELE